MTYNSFCWICAAVVFGTTHTVAFIMGKWIGRDEGLSSAHEAEIAARTAFTYAHAAGSRVDPTTAKKAGES